MDRLQGKIAIITGGARGMGSAEASLFVQEGARVVVADVLDAEGHALVSRLGDRAAFVHLDVSDEESWAHTLAVAREVFGAPDVLINNAGILHVAPLVETTASDLRRIIDVNLVGPYLGMKIVGRAMTHAGRGSIVNVSSTGGMIGMSMISAYVASKWGVRGVTKSAAIEFGRHGVRVNSLHPGGVATVMAGAPASVLSEPPAFGVADSDPVLAALDQRSSAQPIARIGRPIEIARLALFLASDESSYCTGMEFVADGGDTAGRDLSNAF
jgi:3alpha(or 20beta)-hydroxysteroid dehydrogenase